MRTLGQSVGAALGVTAVTVAVAGCASPPTTESALATQQGTGDIADVPPPTLQLAEQARRDVQQLRELQRSDDLVPPLPSTRPEVQWTIPSPQSAPRLPESIGIKPPPLPPPVTETTTREDLPAPTARDRPPVDVDDVAPITGGPGDRLEQLIVELSAELYREAAYGDMPLRELLLIAATMMVSPDRALVPEAIPGLTDRERELMGKMQTFFAQLGRDLEKTGDPEVVVSAVDALHKTLATEPRLQLTKAALCTEVRGFGSYDEFPRNEAGHYTFLAHHEQQAVVYVEIDEFTSELNGAGQWVTELSQQLVVYSDRDGIPVWREDWQAGVDTSHNRRDDFWMVQVINLPAELSVGRYQLKIRIRDEKSRAEAETSVEFEMLADPRLAAPATP